MPKTELPFQTVPVSNDGVQTLLAQATDPAFATLASTELQEHPRTTVTTLFRLSPKAVPDGHQDCIKYQLLDPLLLDEVQRQQSEHLSTK
jgi:hypothetical protein